MKCTTLRAQRTGRSTHVIAAPLLGPRNQILGTFSFSIPTRNLTPAVEEPLKLRVHEIGILASEHLQKTAYRHIGHN